MEGEERFGPAGYGRLLRGDTAQASVEWVGLAVLVAAVTSALALAGTGVPGAGVVHSLGRSLLCAVSLSDSCLGRGSLDATYGPEVSGLVRTNAPDLLFGPGLIGLPVDFRSCRSPLCADSPGEGVIRESSAGESVTLFTRVIDCRHGEVGAGRRAEAGTGEAGDGGVVEPAPGCASEGYGNLYIQYWAYYPESASLRGIPVLEEEGYHPHDWESVQVRINGEGRVDQRASSHAGYNYSRSAANWGSDLGWGFLRGAAEAAGLRREGGWGEASGRLLIAGGSHAGNVQGRIDGGRYPSWTPSGMLRLIPLEQVRRGPLARPARFDPITPPWQKRVWSEPEAEGTG